MLSGDDVKGRARYMLTLNDCLRRSVTERWARAEKRWSQFDGLVRITDATRAYLQTQRLNARAYSVSALQKYAVCPYQFFLSAAYRLAPLEEPEPLQRMDPLTKGSLFHQVQAEFFRALQKTEARYHRRAHGPGACDARRHARRDRGRVLREACAGDRPRLAGRGRRHPHRPSRLGRSGREGSRLGALALRVRVRSAGTARPRS